MLCMRHGLLRNIGAMRLCLILLILFRCLASAAPLLKPGDRVLILGDSNTHSGYYVAALDLIVRCRMPGANIQMMNAGLASETLSGTSEKTHPWPRPDVHERAARAIEKARPTVVVWCYGMNDGIYAPPDAGRMEKFRAGTRDLSRMSRAAGARVVILTPPPFDPVSYRGQLSPDGAPDYGFQAPWRNYNQTLAGYAAWLRDNPENLADVVVDIHTPLTSIIAAWHKTDPKWSSGDGIHPIQPIHWLMAAYMAEALGIPGSVAELSAAGPADAGGGWSFTFNAAPPVAAPAHTPAGFFEAGGFRRTINRFTLTQPVAPAGAMRLKSGDRLLGIVTREQLARGVDLSRFPALSVNRDAGAALPLALERHSILSAAWREHIGHTRPDTDRRALPIAEALAAAAKIEERMNALLAPREESLRLESLAP